MTAPVTVTVDDVLERFPQFEGQDDLIETLLAEAVLFVNADTWEVADIKPATMYLVAHMLTTEETADSLPVTSEHLGPIGISYAAPTTGVDPFSLTEFGRRFLMYRKRNFPGGPVVI